mgnify:CR=1 FL=1
MKKRKWLIEIYGNLCISAMSANVSNVWSEENVALTKKVVDYAHKYDVTVEGELGVLAGIEDDINVSDKDASFTDPDQALDFIQRTGCDSLAVAIGTSHGAYKFKGAYRDGITQMINDKQQKEIIQSNLTTEVPKKAKMMGKNWLQFVSSSTFYDVISKPLYDP